MGKLLYRVNETMDILAIEKSKLYELVQEGELIGHNDSPGHKGLRITAESIRAYYEKYIEKK